MESWRYSGAFDCVRQVHICKTREVAGATNLRHLLNALVRLARAPSVNTFITPFIGVAWRRSKTHTIQRRLSRIDVSLLMTEFQPQNVRKTPPRRIHYKNTVLGKKNVYSKKEPKNPLPPSDAVWKEKKNRGSSEFSIVTIKKKSISPLWKPEI